MFSRALTPPKAKAAGTCVRALGAIKPSGHYRTQAELVQQQSYWPPGHTGRPVRFFLSSMIFVRGWKDWVCCQALEWGDGSDAHLSRAQRLIQPSPPRKRLSALTPAMGDFC